MTREEAIQYAEDKLGKGLYRLDLGYLNRGLYQIVAREVDFMRVAIAALREQDGSFQNGKDHNTVKDWPSYMDLPRDRDVTDINVGNKWISVADRLPKPHETVLVIRRNQRKKLSVECGYYMGNGDWQVGTRLTRPVTHWMPLPELPKEG